MSGYIGWFANIFIVIGLWFVGNKRRSAFLFTVAGELLWTGYATYRQMWDLALICAVFAGLAARNWVLWGKK
jgi:hypothetical protein